MINLGETIVPALNIPHLKGFGDWITPRGFAFDGAGAPGKGCKTPLGNAGNESPNGKTFELIQTPTKMAQYLGMDREKTDWPKREPQLPMEMLNFTRIIGDNDLVQEYRSKIEEELEQSYGEKRTLREYLAKEHLRGEDERNFDPTLGSLERKVNCSKSSTISIVYLIYRSIDWLC